MSHIACWPPVSVIVPHYRHESVLKECLERLTAQDYPGDTTIYVVDNSDANALAGWASSYPGIVFLWEPTPGSYSARNRALECIRDGMVAFTDADCRPRANWLRKGVERLLSDENIGIVGGKVVVTPRNPTRTDLSEIFEMVVAFPQEDYVRKQRFAVTANMFTRRSVFSRAGAFESRLKSGGDSRWGRQVSACGYAVVYEADAIVEHDARSRGEARHKARRLAGGAYDMNPGWRHAASYAAGNILATRKNMISVCKYSHATLPLWRKPAVAAYAVCFRTLIAYYRIRCEVLRDPTPR